MNPLSSPVEVDLLQEQAYEKFCSGELSREELLAALETISMISFTDLITSQRQERHNGKL